LADVERFVCDCSLIVIAVDFPSARLSHRSTAAAAAGGFAAEVWRWPAVDIDRY